LDAPAAAPRESDVLAVGRLLIAALEDEKQLSAARFNSMMVDRISDHEELRAALFRLVDVTPMCRDTPEVAEHLAALLNEIEAPGRGVRLMRRTAGSPFLAGPTGLLARAGVKGMASRFIVGESVEDALGELAGMWHRGVASTVDLLGEATVTEREADTYADRCERTLTALAAAAPSWPSRPHLETDMHGAVPRVNLSVKVSAMTPNARPDDPARGAAGAAGRLLRLLRAARDCGAHLHVDMESLDLRETVTGLVFDLLSESEFRDGPSVGMVMQGYLIDSPEELERWLDWQNGSARTTPLTVRLVKGAYWDHEVVEARQSGWAPPVFTDRAACDRNFETLTRTLVSRLDLVRPAIASHNLRSISHAMAAAELAGGVDAIEFQVLRGLGDDIEKALAELGFRVRTYSPIGDLIAGMAYLVRRLLENTSNESFLRARAGADSLDSLLVAP
jgi:RHH-type proline utilization regulon transcriptional repressor/proline dehydrogenase/delta 1-pyrroline-5-carboxylate dehydrogenase